MPFRKGYKPSPNAGRKPGTPNKTTREVRDALVQAFERKGGVEWLVGLDDQTFAGLLRKLIPNEIAATITGQIGLRVVDLSDQRRDDGLAEG